MGWDFGSGNALSKRVEVTVRHDGQVYNIAFENGEKVQDLPGLSAPAVNVILAPASISGGRVSSTARVFLSLA